MTRERRKVGQDRHDRLGKHGMTHKEGNMGTEGGNKTQGLAQTYRSRHTERDTEGKDKRGNLTIKELNREYRKLKTA